ncbi:MAG TPA: patatin-like phospholipase family protein [Reyranella sp.]|nr:patatin-like phospholipase family protein [Reyranella sp.]
MVEQEQLRPFRVLSLDGGGAKGFYTLGVLKEIEALAGPLHERFDLVYGTSTGAIIAALIGLGHSVDEIWALYKEHVIKVMASYLPWNKSAALAALASEVFGEKDFSSFKTRVGIVCTRWGFSRPMIFKSRQDQAHRRAGSFYPGFGCRIGDVVQASCSAYPFFCKKLVKTSMGERIELADGGFCANNPTLYAIADSTRALKVAPADIRVVSIGVGEYPTPKRSLFSPFRWVGYLFTVRLLQKVLEINTQSMDQLRVVLFSDVPTVRINNVYTQPEMATDLFEHDEAKLDLLWQRGRQSYEQFEPELQRFLF